MGRIENGQGYVAKGITKDIKGCEKDRILGNATMLKIDYRMLKESKQAQSP